ncbi:hypothetical protein HispidOSU_002135, partial [Sigmodon hispidus]
PENKSGAFLKQSPKIIQLSTTTNKQNAVISLLRLTRTPDDLRSKPCAHPLRLLPSFLRDHGNSCAESPSALTSFVWFRVAFDRTG